MLFRRQKETDPYEALAKTLHRIPQGFDLDEGKIYIRVLKWIFTPEEAAIAARMKLIPETPEKMAKRLKMDVDYLKEILPVMDNKGQIRETKSRKDGSIKYGLMPFVVGIYEEQLERMDREFSELMEEYFAATRYDELFSKGPEIFRIVPAKQVMPAELEIHAYQDAEQIVRNARSWGVRECICKKQREILDEGCDYSKNVCLTMSGRENAYSEDTVSKPVSMDEALQLLRDAEEEGLIHSTMNVAEKHGYICNCCTCCCGVMRGLVQYGQPNALVKSNYQLKVVEENCVACENCVERCQFDALSVDEICEVDLNKCVGCGVCVLACDDEALELIPREGAKKPTKNILTWMLKKAWKRRVNPRKVF